MSGGVLVGDRVQKLVEDNKLRIDGKSSPSLDQKAFTAPEQEKTRGPGDHAAGLNHPTSTEYSPAMQATALEPDGMEVKVEDQEAETALEQENNGLEKSSDKDKNKAEKAQRRLERRARKEARRVVRAECHAATMSSPSDRQSEAQHQPHADNIRLPSAVAITTAVGGRHAFRQRYVRQKKLAVMDPKALNEVGALPPGSEESC